MSPHERPQRLSKPFFTAGTIAILVFMAVGYAFGITRLLLGLRFVTNLDDINTWGIWISFDVACGVALAAGGFTTAALVDIFGKKKFKPLLRPAILTAFLGYLWVAIALMFDLGRWWNIWRPLFNWQGNSVLFEVGMCVMAYLMVLAIETSPAVLEGLRTRAEGDEWGARVLRKIKKPILTIHSWIKIILPVFIVAGVVLSCMHQSSLGTLMMIAHTKLNPIWDTPILPLLFLMSAMAVGYPMVILESIYSSTSFGRKPEMDLLAPLSRFIPWFLGAYAVVKIGDLVVRHRQLDFVSHPGATVALAVELLLGVVAPLFLLMNDGVRRSVGWLFFSVCLVIFGVILNRFNVFLVAYEPPFSQKAYFPSVGEISMTIAIVCSIFFCYRFMVTFFPILPGNAAAEEKAPSPLAHEGAEAVSPFWTWVVRGLALASVFGFVFLYVVVHREAIQASELTVKEVQRVTAARPPARASEKSPAYPHRPSGYKNFYLLDAAVLRAQSDDYEPVPFAHRIHDELVGGDCGVCHHRYASSPEDRVGTDIKEIHASMDVKLGGPCSACHDNMADRPPQSCMHCHGLPNEADAPSRIGLKGAYHRQCIGCHERQRKPTTAPTECAGCHHPWTPNHAALVSFKEKPGPQDVTRECLTCHAKVGQDILSTAHWNWKGRSPTIVGQEHRAKVALASTINGYYITVSPNAPQSAATHIGYGRMDGTFDFKDPSNIDCLVCHDSTGTYRKEASRSGLPDPSLDLGALAAKVGRPGRRECGSCHFGIGGAPNAAHGDLEPVLAANAEGLDMHMGTLNMRCQDCHTTTAHRIAGMSFSAPAVEGRVRCEKCHGLSPHGVAGPLSRHLDDHVRAVACETCHIPSFAHVAPTLVRRDFSVAGEDRPEKTDAYGRPSYDRKLGALTWAKDVKPVYLWFDGTRSASLVGEKIDPSKPVVLSAPVGEKRTPDARIFPFKPYTAVFPYDTRNKVLALPELEGGFWTHFDMSRAIADGMKQAGVPYSGEYGFVETKTYTSIHHEVVPAKKALGCADCHEASAVTCTRCHQKAQQMDLPEHRRKVYPEVKERLDFKALGYPGDPALVGGRFYISIGRGKPPA